MCHTMNEATAYTDLEGPAGLAGQGHSWYLQTGPMWVKIINKVKLNYYIMNP